MPGPLFFIIYVNDIINVVDGKVIRLFSDDAALFVQGKDVSLVYKDIKKRPDITEKMVSLATDWRLI